MHHLAKVFALGSLVFLVACSKQEQQQNSSPDSAKIAASTTPVKEGQGRGIIKGIDTASKTMLLDHNDIPGVMDAMAMNYKVDNPALLSAAKVGDSISFTLQDRGEGNFVVTKVTPIQK